MHNQGVTSITIKVNISHSFFVSENEPYTFLLKTGWIFSKKETRIFLLIKFIDKQLQILKLQIIYTRV